MKCYEKKGCVLLWSCVGKCEARKCTGARKTAAAAADLLEP